MVKVKDLIPHPENPNKHPDEQITRLAEILEYQGWRYPIKVSKASGYITAGHGRLLAAKKLGLKVVPVNFQDYDSEEQEYADVTADNAIALWAELDLAAINAKLPDLGPEFNIDTLGIKDFILEPAEKVALCDEDEIPEKVEAKTKLGDLYILGEHRLLCGDSTDLETVEKLTLGHCDMIFTDPPYGMNFQSNYRKATPQFDKIKNDDNILEISNILWALMNENTAAYICCRWDLYDLWLAQFKKVFSVKNLVVWHKPGGGMGDLINSYQPAHEFLMVIHHGLAPLREKRYSDVWTISKDASSSYKHPTQKPVELAEFAIKNHSDNGNTVVDLFGGSGSTLIACEKTNRKCFMMELDPHYCDVIVARWEKYTGKKAVLS